MPSTSYVVGGLARFRLAAAVLDSLPDATAVVDEAGVITSVNRAWQVFAVDNGGRPETTGVGVSYLATCRRAADAGCAEAAGVAAGLHAVLRGTTVQYELEYPCPSPAARRWFLLRITRLAGPHAGAVVSHVSITRRKAAEDVVASAAAHDPLTGLANRRLFAEHLDAALAEGAGTTGVLSLDLDGFTGVNDTYGHGAGDEVLLTAAHRLRTAVPPQHSVARLGGDEFAVLAPGSSPESVRRLGERLAQALAVPHRVHGRLLTVPSSVGWALAAPGEHPAAVLRRADEARCAAKRSRRLGDPSPELHDQDPPSPLGEGRRR